MSRSRLKKLAPAFLSFLSAIGRLAQPAGWQGS